MKRGTLTGLFESTGTYINMTPTEKKIEKRKNQPRNKPTSSKIKTNK